MVDNVSEIYLEYPWSKIRFKTENGFEYEGYIYLISGDKFYISQNQQCETMMLAQNWVISESQIIKYE